MYFQQEFPTATMKHLLSKNGSRKTPEVEVDLQCEKLLNKLAAQQKQQQSAIENSSPPSKRQRLLGVNENNQIVIADTLSPNRKVLAFYTVPSKASARDSEVQAPSNSCVDGTDAPLKSTSVEQPHQSSNSQLDAEHDIVCIDDDDDDDDDSVVVLTDSPKKANSCSAVPSVSAKNAEPLCQKVPLNPVASSAAVDDDSVVLLTDSPKAKGCAVVPSVSVKNAELPCQKATVSSSSSSAVNATSLSAVVYGVSSSENNCAAASVSYDDTADSENISSSSGVGGQHQASAAASGHHSPSSRKIDRLEKLLEVGVFAHGFLSYGAQVEDTEVENIYVQGVLNDAYTYLKLQVRTRSSKYILKALSTYFKLYIRT